MRSRLKLIGDWLIVGWSLLVLASATWRALSGDTYWIRHIGRDAVVAGVIALAAWGVVSLRRKE